MEREVLVCVVGRSRCALALASVIETMRPLPIEAVTTAPAGVLGVAIVRGAPTVVVDAAALLGQAGAPITRFVTLRAAGRTVALAVQAVEGVRALPAPSLHALPPLLRAADTAVLDQFALRDRELVAVLQLAQLLPEGP